MRKYTKEQKELFEELWGDLRAMYQRDVAMADNGIPFMLRLQKFVDDMSVTELICKPVEVEKMEKDVIKVFKVVVKNPMFAQKCNAKDIKHSLTTQCYRDDDYEVTELPDTPEIPVVETGVLMSPAEIAKSNNVYSINYKCTDDSPIYTHYNDDINIGRRITIADHDYPYSFYKQIKTKLDYSKIPVGAVVEVFNGFLKPCGWVVKNKDNYIAVGLHNKYDSAYCLYIGYYEIQSLKILAMPEETK